MEKNVTDVENKCGKARKFPSFFSFTYIYREIGISMISDKRIRQIISEEISKADVESIASRKIDNSYDSKDFKKAVRKVVADAIEDFYRLLWNRSSIWKSSITK